ncbi:MAG: tetratricopeptide repeat protein, partial [Nitrospirae bacterium]|nr:tetratricopeptide repeat protein [Nitrospirota bacterium]
PVNVESVAWVSERKNLLSTFFWFLTILSYTFYVKRRGIVRYALTVMCFLFGLLSKPMLVTLPFVLLLLDFWPLKRFTAESTKKLFTEKLPFIGLSLIFICITIFTQKSGGNVVPLYMLPAGVRLENAFLSYIRYSEKIFWPYNFSIFYPYVVPRSILPIIASAGVVLVMTAFSIIKRQQYPWLFTGWFWFAGTLIPVIQIVQVGWASIADRYAYIPQIGIFIVLSFSLLNLLKEKTFLQKPTALVFILILCFLYARTHVELKHWRTSESLYLHAMEVTDNNYVALGEYGLCLMNKGKVRESIPYFLKALEILPDSPTLNYYTWKAYKTIGETVAAARYFVKASPLLTGDSLPSIPKMLGFSLLKGGRYKEARDNFLDALKISNTDTEIYEGLAQSLIGLNNREEAIKYVETGLQLKPDTPGLLKLKHQLSIYNAGDMKNGK